MGSAAWLVLTGAVMVLGAAAVVMAHARLSASAVWRRLAWVERQREVLAQAELDGVSVEAWVGGRLGLSLLAGICALFYFPAVILAPVAAAVTYHVQGLWLERRRRQREETRQVALVDGVRYGSAVLSRAGNALQMIRALSESGPVAVRPVFVAILSDVERTDDPLPLALERARQRVADPLFDDLALAVIISARHGGKLVPALEALIADWDKRIALRRDAKSLRANMEASVRILAVVPLGFLAVVQLVSPQLLLPLRSVAGEVLLAACAASMVYGYRVLQRIAAPARVARLRLIEG